VGKTKEWGIASCKKCQSLNQAEEAIESLRHMATERTVQFIDSLRGANEEDITDHILWHADTAPIRKSK
jgi:hypothetical protein